MFLKPGQLLRLIYINIVLVRHGLEEVVFAIHLFRPLRFVLFLLPWHWFRKTDLPHGKRVRRALEDLGPIFVKFGQMLSTRRDLLPEDIADELARLQDNVPPFPGSEARQIIERAYEMPLEAVFSSFDETPLASASIAQVHIGTLHDGSEIIVKVLRPQIEKIIRRDIGLLYIIAALAQRYWPDGRRLRPVEVVSEYEKTILDELDLMREAANASQLRRNFENSPLLYVPDVYWPHTRRNVMVMERIYGVPVGNLAKLREMGVDMQKLSERGVEIFFTQVFRHNFFHADMHPGNIFVSKENPDDPRYLAVDFGIVGTLSPTDQRYLAENFVAFFNRDYRRVAELHLESGWVPVSTRVDEFESAIRTVCEPIFERPLSEISFGHLLLRLFQTARRFNMEVQPQLVLLQKTLLNIEGLGRELYPQLDLWKTAKPFLDRWMDEQIGIRGTLKTLRTQLPLVATRLPEVPDLLYNALKNFEASQTRMAEQNLRLEKIQHEIKLAKRHTAISIITGSIIIALTLWFLKL